MAECFKYNENVYDGDADNIADFIRNEEIYSTEDFDNSLDEEYDYFEVCGHTYNASEIFQNLDEYAYEEEYDSKVKELADDVADQIENAELGEVIDFRGYSLVACDAEGNTESSPTVHILIDDVSYTVKGDEEKSVVFKVIQRNGEENAKYEVEIPLVNFKALAKDLLF